jgi:glycosyltransferase involved in cell wall biosynthesis
MKVTVVVTCFNEEQNIGPCLESLVAQSYPDDQFEILVTDGGSRDSTQQIVKQWAAQHAHVRLEIETKKGTAAGRNAGIDRASYDHIAFIDADCVAPSDWLQILVDNYLSARARDPKIVAVGGTNLPPEDAEPFVKAIGIALDSYLGSFGSAQGRQFKVPRLVDGLATLNVLLSREVLLEMNRFDETLGSEAEDADLNYRLRQAGYRLLFVPESYVWHRMRPTPRGWWRNMFRYGKGRARLLKRHPQMWSVAFLLPLCFLLTLASVLLIPAHPIFWLALTYFPVLAIFSHLLARQKCAPELTWQVLLVFLIQHFGYAFGEVYGLCSRQVR